MFPPSKIAGTRIAYARATWVQEEGSDKGHYSFFGEDSFNWTLNPGQLQEMGVDEQDLMDCVEQAEKQFGAPEDYRPALGLLPKAGIMNIGATFVSSSNKGVSCVFTPPSMDHPTTLDTAVDFVAPDAYFEWYYLPETEEVTVDDFLKDFDRLTGARTTETAEKSPIVNVPSYEEASVRTANLMGESERDAFLQKVWNYHHVPATFHLKESIRPLLEETWTRVLRVERVMSVYKDGE